MDIVIGPEIFIAQGYGGVSRCFVRLAEHLPAAGVTPHLAAPLHINPYLAASGLAPHALRLRDGLWERRLARLVAAAALPLAIARHKPAAVHQSWYLNQPRAGRGPAIVATVHDLIPERFPTAANALVRRRCAAAIARADHLICISEATRRDLAELFPGAAAKARVIHHGFDALPLPADSEALHHRPYLLFVGQRPGYKNFAGLLAAYAASPGVNGALDLVAVGGGPFTTDETAAIAAHGVAGRVHHRRADDAGLARFYAHAALLVYPSLYEGFGIPPLEAMAAGTPVVAMRASSVPEICGPAAEYADPGEPDSLGAAIAAVLGSPSRGAELVAAGYAQVRRYSWADCARATAEVYRSLA